MAKILNFHLMHVAVVRGVDVLVDTMKVTLGP